MTKEEKKNEKIEEEEKNRELDEKILAWLEQKNSLEPNTFYNFSEISRAVNKAPPTVKRAVLRLEEDGKVEVIDKKSMKLVNLVE